MKKIIKYTFLVVMAGLFTNSCETTDLNLRTSPNDLAPDQADPNLLLNSIQFAYVDNIVNFNDFGSELTRIDYMFGRDYFNNYPGATFNSIWSQYYSSQTTGVGSGVSVGMLTNLNRLEEINAESEINYNFHVGVGKVLQAHQLMLIVDYLGEAALSEAGDPVEFPAPSLDDGAAVYAGALSILDEAEALLSGDAPTLGASDFFYDGDTAKWIRAINSIRLKAFVTTNDQAAFDAVIAADNFISETEDDFQFQYGSRPLQPDTRHQDYALDYSPSGANIYQSNWLMEYMLTNNDPRIRYYFYRQVGATPGADAPPNEEDLACSLVVPPQHFQDGGFTYCSLPEGYWGRTHGNDEGTPPDGFKRTAVGVYPAGGQFDDNDFDDEDAITLDLGTGGGGAGIEPVILASYIDFWRGDMADSDDDRATFLRAGMEKSIAKVQSFGTLDPTANLADFAPDEDDVSSYIDMMVDNFEDATGDDKENVYAEQYWVAMYGGGKEAYNYYRKTGFPTTLVPNWEPNPGPFPRSFLYPQNEVVTNPNLTQKETLTQQVFWDDNPTSPSFPPAN